jgi:hypothetical protein
MSSVHTLNLRSRSASGSASGRRLQASDEGVHFWIALDYSSAETLIAPP